MKLRLSRVFSKSFKKFGQQAFYLLKKLIKNMQEKTFKFYTIYIKLRENIAENL